MKNIILVLVSMIAGIVLLSMLLGVEWNPSTNCFKLSLPIYVEIYSESNFASNIVARLQPDDVLIFCGEKK